MPTLKIKGVANQSNHPNFSKVSQFISFSQNTVLRFYYFNNFSEALHYIHFIINPKINKIKIS